MLEEIATLQTLEKLYRIYLHEPDKLDPSWVSFFRGMELFPAETVSDKPHQVKLLIEAFRNFGHLAAPINPLYPNPEMPKILTMETFGLKKTDLSSHFSFHGSELALEEIIARLKRSYLSPLAVEFSHCEPSLKKFIQDSMELSKWQLEKNDKLSLIEDLVKAEMFEHFLHTQFVGQTRFSVEGTESLVPMLSFLASKAGLDKTKELLIGMAHRGRLNVLTHILQKSPAAIFYECLSKELPEYEGSSDVKYHKGFSSLKKINDSEIELYMPANPSHLESINPVMLGIARAKQKSLGGAKAVLPVVIHGDASFSCQGVVYETQQLMYLKGYSVGGTIHIIVNNQIGFTATPSEGRSTMYPSDLAKSFGCPIFHVNNEHPEQCLQAIDLAYQIRKQFQIDSFIDLIGFRKYGHNEGDEPNFTQPQLYQTINSKETAAKQYAKKLLEEGIEDRFTELEKNYKKHLEAELKKAKEWTTPPAPNEIYGKMWQEFEEADEKEFFEKQDTTVGKEDLKEYIEKLTSVPEGFSIHPKLKKIMQNKRKALQADEKDRTIDWGLAESLAFASILSEKIPVRISGQDSQRGTFSQRHAVWVDQKNGGAFIPLSQFSTKECFFEVMNSPLSEFAILGYEHGFSLSISKALNIWEAQYGDFANGAQIIIDEYIASTEQKWRCRGDIVVLLPHGYEGQGPDHSSGRIERFLELSAEENMQVCLPSNAKQYFHLLRRQAKRKIKKPLIVFTPKWFLRIAGSMSSLKELSEGSFEEIMDDPGNISNPKRMVFCSGKIFHELFDKREKEKDQNVVLIRIEQFYPFAQELCKKIVAKYSSVDDFVYVQEEPRNMGAWPFISQLSDVFPKELRYIGRKAAASPSTGSSSKHKDEQEQILTQVFSK